MRRVAPLVLAIAFVACSRGSASPTVSMTEHSFAPETIEIAAGTEVRWVNDTEEAHTVTAVDASVPEASRYFSSSGADSEEEALDSLNEELLDPGESFAWTFDDPGTYRYYCIPHRQDGMRGVVVVE